MKKFLALLLVLFLALPAFAEAPLSAEVYVSISDDAGVLVLAYVPVVVTDADGDGALTLCDALIAAHAAYYPEGAAGFVVAPSQYGLSLMKLWGVENGGSYGYYLNDASAWSLADPIANGDHVKAFAYTDLMGWSDTYSFFEAPMVEAVAGADVPLTLSAAGYDEMWNPVTLAVSGAVITVNGENTEIVTDETGAAVLTFVEPGVYVVSAAHEAMTLVPPVCIVTVTAE